MVLSDMETPDLPNLREWPLQMWGFVTLPSPETSSLDPGSGHDRDPRAKAGYSFCFS